MKRLEDIERMDADRLEACAEEEDIRVPDGLEERIKAAIAAKEAADSKVRVFKPAWIPLTVTAAAAIAAVAIIPGIVRQGPKDTFDDPYLAYAQVEATFQKISEKMGTGVELAAKAGETASKPATIINKINGK